MTHDEIDQFIFVTGSGDGRQVLIMHDGDRAVELVDSRGVRQGSFELLASAPHFYKANAQSIVDLQTMINIADRGAMTPDLMIDVFTKMQNNAMNLQRIALFGAESVVNEANAEARTGKRK